MHDVSMTMPCRNCGTNEITIGVGTLLNKSRLLDGRWRWCRDCQDKSPLPEDPPLWIDLPWVKDRAAVAIETLREQAIGQAVTRPDVRDAVQQMGRWPIAVPGECAKSALLIAIALDDDEVRVCHQRSTSTWPGREGLAAVSGWLEVGDQALNTVWGFWEPAEQRRKKNPNVAGEVVEYARADVDYLWRRYGTDIWHLALAPDDDGEQREGRTPAPE